MSKAIWQLYEAAIDPQTVNAIITECEYYQPVQAGVGIDDTSRQDKKIRESEIRWIDRNDVNSRFIADLIHFYVMEANRNAFDVDVNYLSDIQYTKYYGHNNGHYSEHQDTFWANQNNAYDRKLSVTIQLSDSDEYEGGDFKFKEFENPNPEALRKKGSVLVFLSPSYHYVEPVTKGERKSLVAWVEGPKWR